MKSGIEHRRRRRIRPIVWWLPISAILLLSGIFYVNHRPLPEIKVTTKQLAAEAPAPVSLAWPDFRQSAIGAVGYGVLETNGDQTPYATASLAKVLTALTVLKKMPLSAGQQGPVRIITQQDVQFYHDYVASGASVTPVNLGGQISEYQALQALLIPSSCNVADTLAIWAYGSIEAFNEAANQLAKELGMTSTTMTDPSGLDGSTMASARDMTILGLKAMENPVIAEIVGQRTAVLPVAGTVTNYNFSLGRNGNIGIKTGNNDEDPGALMFAVNRDIGGKSVTFIGTVMGAPNLFATFPATDTLVDSAVSGFGSVKTAVKTKETAVYSVPWQGTVSAVVSADASFDTWINTKLDLKLSLDKVGPNANKGSRVGKITVTNPRGPVTQELPVTLSQDIKPPGFWWRLKDLF